MRGNRWGKLFLWLAENNLGADNTRARVISPQSRRQSTAGVRARFHIVNECGYMKAEKSGSVNEAQVFRSIIGNIIPPIDI